ncbi:hypothetical protein B0H17DRAFT_1150308 [Mycena rosella]|uniref:Uncharacterized protein n=1 Tax=Mycena rosella TaxID=1033263 RepID=A0AAD7FPT1_MYCRO|nr:hypothetical protein B0H17DRAFT_1150308 [Mycena rosella]
MRSQRCARELRPPNPAPQPGIPAKPEPRMEHVARAQEREDRGGGGEVRRDGGEVEGDEREQLGQHVRRGDECGESSGDKCVQSRDSGESWQGADSGFANGDERGVHLRLVLRVLSSYPFRIFIRSIHAPRLRIVHEDVEIHTRYGGRYATLRIPVLDTHTSVVVAQTTNRDARRCLIPIRSHRSPSGSTKVYQGPQDP